jgi:O-antigen/teichoic acid export membrane protein
LALNIQGMVLVIGVFLGPAAVTIFTAYRTLTRLLVQLITLLNQAIWPEISAAYGAGAIDAVSDLHQKGSAVTFWIGLAGVICIGVGGNLIIGIWTRHAFEPNHVLLGLLLTAGFLNILWQTSWVVLMATNRHQKISVAFIASAAIGLAISVLFFPYFGMSGAALALIVAELPMLFFAISSALGILNDSWSDYAKAIIGAPFKQQRSYK